MFIVTAKPWTLKAFTLAVALLSLVVGALAFPGHASAQAANLVSCSGTESIVYSPGITNTPRQVTNTVTDNLFVCVHSSAPILMPATANAQITHMSSCFELLQGGAATRTFHWSDGETSTFSSVSTINIVNGNIVVAQTGTITAGLYQGASATGTVVLTPLLSGGELNLNDACASPTGLVSLSGTYIFNVLPF